MINFFPISILSPILEPFTHRMSALDVILLAEDVVHQDPFLGGGRVLVAEVTSRFSWSSLDIVQREFDDLCRGGEEVFVVVRIDAGEALITAAAAEDVGVVHGGVAMTTTVCICHT
jgi:hypothetical protein